MRDAPWTRLVRELKDAGYESPYLDRLRARLDPAEAFVATVRAYAAAQTRRSEPKLAAVPGRHYIENRRP